MADDRVKKYIETRVAEADGEVTRHAREADGARNVLASILRRFEEAKIDVGAWRRIYNMHTRTSPMSASPGADGLGQIMTGRPEPSIDQLEREQASMARFSSKDVADAMMSAVDGKTKREFCPPEDIRRGILSMPGGSTRYEWSAQDGWWVRTK